MVRHPLVQFAFAVRLPYGKREWRVSCPTCGGLHAEIEHGGISFCIGCGQTLVVQGDELLVSVIPDESFPAEEDYRRDQPDFPSFWHEGNP